jgi:hypothetical protein
MGKPHALRKVKKKKEAYACYLNTRNGEDYLSYQAARRKSRKATREAAKAYEQRIARDGRRYENQM